MGRPKKSAGGDVAAAERVSRDKAQKSYREDSEEEDEEPMDTKDKDFSEEEDVSAEDSGSEWGGESSGSEYGKKKKKTPAKGKGAGRGRKSGGGTPKGKATGRGRGRPAKNGKAAPAKRGKKHDSDDESEEEGNTSGSEYGKKKASPKKKATPVKAKASPKPRGRKPAAKRAASPDDEEEEEEESRASSRRGGRATKASKSYKEVSEDEIGEVSEEEKPVTKRAKLEPKKKPEAKEKKESEEDEDESMEEDEKVEEKKNGTSDEKKEEVKEEKKPKAGKNGNGKAHSEDGSEEDEKEVVEDEEEYGSAHSDVEEKNAAEKELKNQTATDYSKIDFECNKKTVGGDDFNFKIAMWNIGGIKSWFKKNGIEYLNHEDPDIMCFNEVKCNDKTKPEDDIKKIEKYPHKYFSYNKEHSGHSGVAIFSKIEPTSVQIGFPDSDSDPVSDKKAKKSFSDEGRLITLEYENFYLMNVYVPNGGKSEKNEEYPKGYPIKVISGDRQKFDRFLREYIKDLDKKKPVILAGDLNCAHKEIDLANPKTNTRTAGFTEEERDDFSQLLEETKLIDTFRTLYPEQKDAYSFWSYKFNARQKNVGWRLDYFLLSEKLKDSLCDTVMRKDVYGSDHCPIVLFIKN